MLTKEKKHLLFLLWENPHSMYEANRMITTSQQTTQLHHNIKTQHNWGLEWYHAIGVFFLVVLVDIVLLFHRNRVCLTNFYT